MELKPDEEFKICPRNSFFKVSEDGRVKNNLTDDGEIIKPTCNHNGYFFVKDPKNEKRIYVHILVASTWLEEGCKEGKVVHHINGRKTDNRASNLQWMDAAAHDYIHRQNPENYWDANGRIKPEIEALFPKEKP